MLNNNMIETQLYEHIVYIHDMELQNFRTWTIIGKSMILFLMSLILIKDI